MPDKKFFWGVCFTIIPDWAKRFHEQVLNARAKKEKIYSFD